MSDVKKAVKLLSNISKNRDHQQALRDLDEVEKSLAYCKKIVTRSAIMKLREEKNQILNDKRNKLYG